MKLSNRTRVVLGLLTALLAACAAPNISPEYKLSQSGGRGVAAGSITYQGPYGAYSVSIQAKGTGDEYLVKHGGGTTLDPRLAFRGEKPDAGLKQRGSPFAIELPAGHYVIKSWHVSSGAANIISTVPIDIEFDVQAGQAIYLGNFHFTETSRVVRLITGASATLSDQSERDIPVLRAAFPALKDTPITQAISQHARFADVGGRGFTRITIPIFVPVR
jgi:hypothetical protein